MNCTLWLITLWWKDIRTDGDGSGRKKRNDSAHCGDNALVPMA
jgi:hypothetical protein